MYEVEAIVGKRINHITKKVQYQVKWAYFSPEESTWMPEQNLKFVKNLIQKYNQSLEMKVDNLVPKEKSKTVKKEPPKLYQIMLSQQQDDFTEKMGIYAEQENQPEKDIKKMIESNKNSLNNSSSTEPYKKQIQYREGSRQSQKKSKIVEKVLNKKPEILSEKSSVAKKIEEKVQPKIRDNVPPIPPDYQNNRHRYLPAESIIAQKQKIKSTMIQKQRDNQTLKKNKIPFYQKHLDKIQEKKKQDNFAQKYSKNSSRVIPPPPPPRLLTPQLSLKQQFPKEPELKDDFQKKELNKSSYEYRYDDTLPLDNLQSQVQQTFYNLDTSMRKQQKISQFKVYSVINMEKTPNGFIYLAQTSEGTKWLVRDELMPQYSTLLVQFYERHLSFND